LSTFVISTLEQTFITSSQSRLLKLLEETVNYYREATA